MFSMARTDSNGYSVMGSGCPRAAPLHPGATGCTKTVAERALRRSKMGSRAPSPRYVPFALVYRPTPSNLRTSRQNCFSFLAAVLFK